jgi:hypothetical protein
MSRLSKLYEAMETLRKEGLPVNESLELKNMNVLKVELNRLVYKLGEKDFKEPSNVIKQSYNIRVL